MSDCIVRVDVGLWTYYMKLHYTVIGNLHALLEILSTVFSCTGEVLGHSVPLVFNMDNTNSLIRRYVICGTCIMLLVMVWQPEFGVLSLSALLRIIILVEVVCAASFVGLYVAYVHQYNCLNSQPDVLKSLYSALQPASPLEEFRYHDGGRLSDQQMALLQYQRENIHYLSEEILRLQECLSKYERSDDGSTPQVDLAHLLAARDQELRALSAEMNQVQSELRLARNLIAEKDLEVQKIYTTNSQYIKENERLRAIMGEWSARATKLERALEAEQRSNLDLQKKISKLRNQSTTEKTEV
ncbi:hypothetical protein C5167_026686 [Papaver somniferum]|nr:hypothetical protein C5167_026686 [Papaver somniferum]